MRFPKYTHIDNLLKSSELFQQECVVTEKIHGTNVRLMWSPENGGLVLGSRNNIIYKDREQKQEFYDFVEFVINNEIDKILEKNIEFHNHIFYGEYYGGSIQKGVTYTNDNERQLRIFDIRKSDGKFIDYHELHAICFGLGFKIVPHIMTGKIELDKLNEMINNNSIVAKENRVVKEDNTWEGFVIKPIFETKDCKNNRLIAKYKSVKFTENAKQPRVPKLIRPEEIQARQDAKEFAETTVTEGRIATIVEHITRDGNEEISMKRTPDFLKELINDIREEHFEVFNKLDKDHGKLYNKALSNLGVKLFKEYVMENG